MSKALAPKNEMTAIESVLMTGDLSGLTSDQRVRYYNEVCASVGLNPLTRPFEYMKFQGKTILYARKDATEQLRNIHRVSITDIKKEVIGDLLHVTVFGESNGKKDLATAALPIAGLKGDALGIAYMKCETKAKRRFTLSICGLGLLDETEVESMQREVNNSKAAQVNNLLNAPPEIELDPEPEIEEPDFSTEAAAIQPDGPGDYIVTIGKKYVGMKLKDISPDALSSFVNWVKEKVERKNPATLEFIEKAEAFLEQA